jgi:uncharacterized protein YunC (DUF1805 family)
MQTIQTHDVQINGKTARGVEIPLGRATLVLVTASGGYIMCGYLDIRTAEKMGDCAAIIRGVATVEDLLKGTIAEATTAARQKGITTGMTGREALALLM